MIPWYHDIAVTIDTTQDDVKFEFLGIVWYNKIQKQAILKGWQYRGN